MLNPAFYLATDQGVVQGAFNETGFVPKGESLAGTSVTSIDAVRGVVLAGTRDGMQRSKDGGTTWSESSEGLAIRHIRWIKAHPQQPGLIFAGTEPAGIYVSDDDGRNWTPRPEVEALRDEHGWWLPYSPEAGCVRGLAFHGRRGYAAVEVGGVLRSDDRGQTWRLAPGSSGDPQFQTPQPGHIHADVHSVEGHPSSPDLVFAATNAGLYRSEDAGASWVRIHAEGYTRAAWIDPEEPRHILSGPAGGVGRNGTIVETNDGGETWTPAAGGLDAPWPRTMVERFYSLGESHLLAVLDDGRVCMRARAGGDWIQDLAPGVSVRALAEIPSP